LDLVSSPEIFQRLQTKEETTLDIKSYLDEAKNLRGRSESFSVHHPLWKEKAWFLDLAYLRYFFCQCENKIVKTFFCFLILGEQKGKSFTQKSQIVSLIFSVSDDQRLKYGMLRQGL